MLKTMLRKPRGGGPVPRIPVALDYKRAVKRQATQVAWNLWLTSDDTCGARCRGQPKFVADIRDNVTSLLAECVQCPALALTTPPPSGLTRAVRLIFSPSLSPPTTQEPHRVQRALPRVPLP